ncbi:MAG TPA: aminotransferase class I/II-fold pyridoxal phosphate-dependent enzyme [Nitrososphaerales archaeon]|nr:aminotransferase class I/II-fold pyridoxal phosphate-dependent enzyme [Nitrososphaerales archaeon]
MTEVESLGVARSDVEMLAREIVRLVGKEEQTVRGLSEETGTGVLDGPSLIAGVLEECRLNGVSPEVGLKILHAVATDLGRSREPSPSFSPMSSFAKAFELQKRGIKLIRLDVGEPDFHPPQAVVKATSDALFGFKTHYTVARGIPPLVSAVQSYLGSRNNYHADEKQVMVTSSGRFAIFAALSTNVREGESVVIVNPNWPAYREIVEFIGARPRLVHTSLERGWEVTPEMVEGAVGPETRALVLSYPSNPHGKIIGESTYRGILDVANRRNLLVISDEIYNEYAYKPCPSILDGGAERFVLTSSFSKTWAMTGFRIGYAVSSKEIVDKMLRVVSMAVTSVPEFIQYGAVEAFGAQAEVAENKRLMKERIEAVGAALSEVQSLEFARPDGAMYYFVRCSRPGFDAAEFSRRLLEDKGVSVTPGGAFGDYGDFFRISLGQPKEVVLEGVRKIGELLQDPVDPSKR